MTKEPLKTRYYFVHFVKVEDKPKTTVWSCRNNDSGVEIGVVKYHGPYRCYCFFSKVEAIYTTIGLDDICEFVRALRRTLVFREKSDSDQC